MTFINPSGSFEMDQSEEQQNTCGKRYKDISHRSFSVCVFVLGVCTQLLTGAWNLAIF